MEEKILSVLAKVNEKIITYNGDNLFDAGILDSLLVIELVSTLENDLNIDIDAQYIIEANLKTKEAIVAMIKRIVG
ncbi:phosphopantetheine-binding protein [Butyrivibrio sp. VCD2006]|uniref:phosphopantetheine-binding protein n=1 Tax=Butyrivibrio sp. VCD2006 TaxID=1280664 RepID=UPI0004018390|nr:phosphopantetheine-binding protein [Butyrivibrio sp. VCD2006]